MSTHPMSFIEGNGVYLRKLVEEDFNERYLRWLNDSEILKYRGAKAYPSSMNEVRAFCERAKTQGDLQLAICSKETNEHLGNISLNSIHWIHRSAELSIMVGEKSCWGKGVGTEAMRILITHGFKNMDLHRIWAESPNPAFNRSVEKLGWTKEGVKREAFLLDGKHVDFECYSILKTEWLKLHP